MWNDSKGYFIKFVAEQGVPYTSELFYEEFNVEKVSEAKTFHKFHLQLFIKLKIPVFSKLSKSCFISATSKLSYRVCRVNTQL